MVGKINSLHQTWLAWCRIMWFSLSFAHLSRLGFIANFFKLGAHEYVMTPASFGEDWSEFHPIRKSTWARKTHESSHGLPVLRLGYSREFPF